MLGSGEGRPTKIPSVAERKDSVCWCDLGSVKRLDSWVEKPAGQTAAPAVFVAAWLMNPGLQTPVGRGRVNVFGRSCPICELYCDLTSGAAEFERGETTKETQMRQKQQDGLRMYVSRLRTRIILAFHWPPRDSNLLQPVLCGIPSTEELVSGAKMAKAQALGRL